jgi:type I restriction enzyme S subunit
MIPDDWQRIRLSEIAEVRTGIAVGKTGIKNPVDLPYLRVANVQDGHINLNEVKRIVVERDQVERYSLCTGDILMTEGGDFDKLGRGDVWQGEIAPCLHQNHVFAVRPQMDRVDPFYLSALAASEYGRAYFLTCAKRSTNLASINSSQLKAFPALLPPLAEQRRIADVLSTWDQAIAITKRLLASSRQQKQELASTLLQGRRRFAGHADRWKYADFDSIFERINRKNTVGNTNVLTISGERGLINQRDYFNKSVASANLSGYTLLARGDFAYNKSYSKGYPMGAIKPLTNYDAGVVSSLYLCFRLRSDVDACSDFFRHYFEAGLFNQEIDGIAQEGARNHGLLNVSVIDFFKLRLHLPSAPEQRHIAEVINVAEAEEKIFAAQLQVLQVEKAALMQQLLTGKRRVPLPAPLVERVA